MPRFSLFAFLFSLALAAAAASALAFPAASSFPLQNVVTLDSASPETPSGPDAATATVSLSSTGAETRVLARLPAAAFDSDTNLLTRAELSLDFRAPSWVSTRPLVLHALTNAYDPAAATWTNRAANTPWKKQGGDPVDRYCVTASVVSVTTGLWRATWNLRPMLWRANTCQCLASNGLLVRMGGSRPSSGAVAAPFEPAASPGLFLVWQDPFLSTRRYAISGISNGPFHKEYATNATDETVFWEQDITTVGRVMLQTNGFESRAILSMPAELREIDPDRIQRVEAHFEAYINTWSGERISLHPVTSPTRLEMAANRPLNGGNPDHGPSWRWADGPVDTNDDAYPRIPWANPGGDFDETVSADASLVKLTQYVDSALFDLTPLWRDPRVRDLLLANGAIIKADRSTWSGTNLCAVQIYCSDDYTYLYKGAYSSFRITLYPSLPAATSALAPDAFFYADAYNPDWKSFGTSRVWVLRNRDPAKGDTHGLLHLPDAFTSRDPALIETAVLRFRSEYNTGPASPAPILLHVLLEPFGHDSLAEAATWNNAFTGGASGTRLWTVPGGAYSASCATGTWDSATQELAFDLAPLLDDPSTAAATATNGLLLRVDPDWDAFGDATFVRYNILANSAALHFQDRPLAFAAIRSDAPDAPSVPTALATLPLDRSPTAETRLLVKFSPSVLTPAPRQIGTVRLYFHSPAPLDALPADALPLLSPLATPSRLASATWNAPWATPGGDLHPAAVPARVSAYSHGLYFNLDPLLADPSAKQALLDNGAIIRFPPSSQETSLLLSGPHADDPDTRPAPLAIPAPLHIHAFALSPTALSLDAYGLDPATTYELQTSSDLTAEDWHTIDTVPSTGLLTLPRPSSSPAFYRVQPAD